MKSSDAKPLRLSPWLALRFRGLVMFAALWQLLAIVGAKQWPFSLMVHFQPQLTLFAGLALVALWFDRDVSPWRTTARVAAALVLLSSLYLIGQLFVPRYPPIDQRRLTVWVGNLNFRNAEGQALLTQLKSADPDVIALVEYPLGWRLIEQALRKDYPHVVIRPEGSPWGMALFSRYPLNDAAVQVSPGGYAAITASLQQGAYSPLQLAVAHPPPPIGRRLFDDRRAYLDWLASRLDTGAPRLVMGDLNLTPWSPLLRDWLAKADLTDGRRMNGIHATWPAALGGLGIPLDYVLVGGGPWVTDMQAIAVAGSDHRAIVAEVGRRP